MMHDASIYIDVSLHPYSLGETDEYNHHIIIL